MREVSQCEISSRNRITMLATAGSSGVNRDYLRGLWSGAARLPCTDKFPLPKLVSLMSAPVAGLPANTLRPHKQRRSPRTIWMIESISQSISSLCMCISMSNNHTVPHCFAGDVPGRLHRQRVLQQQLCRGGLDHLSLRPLLWAPSKAHRVVQAGKQ